MKNRKIKIVKILTNNFVSSILWNHLRHTETENKIVAANCIRIESFRTKWSDQFLIEFSHWKFQNALWHHWTVKRFLFRHKCCNRTFSNHDENFSCCLTWMAQRKDEIINDKIESTCLNVAALNAITIGHWIEQMLWIVVFSLSPQIEMKNKQKKKKKRKSWTIFPFRCLFVALFFRSRKLAHCRCIVRLRNCVAMLPHLNEY